MIHSSVKVKAEFVLLEELHAARLLGEFWCQSNPASGGMYLLVNDDWPDMKISRGGGRCPADESKTIAGITG